MVLNRLKEVKNSLFGRVSDSVTINVNGDEIRDGEHKDYIELEPSKIKEKSAKIFVKYFVLTEYADVKPVLDSLREGFTVALVKIRPLRDKDMTELKRAINKIKSTIEAIDGDLVGIDQDWIVAVPQFVEVYRGETLPDKNF